MNFFDQCQYGLHVRRARLEGFTPLTGPQFAALVRKINGS